MEIAKTEPKNDRLQISQPEKKRSEISAWLIDELTILAVSLADTLTAARLKIYVAELADLAPDQLRIALKRAHQECRFFPKIAELRELAGPTRKQLNEAGAVAAWNEVLTLISKWGVAREAHFVYGPAPELDARTEYAIRCVGGLDRINRCPDSAFGFVQKQFQNAWECYDVTKNITFADLVRCLDGETVGKIKRLGGRMGMKAQIRHQDGANVGGID